MQLLHCSVAPVKVAAVYVPSEYPQHRGTLGVLCRYCTVAPVGVVAMFISSEYPKHRST